MWVVPITAATWAGLMVLLAARRRVARGRARSRELEGRDRG